MTAALPPEPNGTPAYQRIVQAIIDLHHAFGVCGLDPPAAILVPRGMEHSLDAILSASPQLLIADKLQARRGELTVWGIPIRPQPARDPQHVEAALLMVLDQVDYTTKACRPNEAVAAVLPVAAIRVARAALKR